MIPEAALKEMVWRIQTTQGLEGCIVGYYGSDRCRVIGFPSCITSNSENVAVVIEEVVVAKQSASLVPPKTGQTTSVAAKQFVTNWSKLGAEVVGMTVSCGLTVFASIGVIGAEIPTGGAATLLFAAGWTGFVTGAIQCGNGVVRVGAMARDLSGSTLDAWDKNKKYATLILLVDAIGVASAVGSLPFAVRKLWDAFCRLRAFNAAKLSYEALRRLNRLERLRTMSKIVDDATRSGEGLGEIVQAAKQAQISARTIQGASGLSINHAETLQRIVSEETIRQLHSKLADVLSNITGLGLSATPASLTGSGSGSVNWIVNVLDAGQPAI